MSKQKWLGGASSIRSASSVRVLGEGKKNYVPPDYCPTGMNLLSKLAGIVLCRNLETGEEYPPETFDEEKCEAARQARDEHFDTCPRCYAEECRVNKYFGCQDTIN
jgi:hypothetical protein